MGDFPYLDWLTRKYKQKAGETGDRISYLQAVGLANACVERESTEERLRLVYEIETQWYNGKHPLTYAEHQKITARHRQSLTDLRDDVKCDFNALSTGLEDLDIEHLYNEETLNQAQVFARNVFEVIKRSNDLYVHIFQQVILSSVRVVHKSGLTAPCPFAVVGLGPVARGETTPHSNLEYAYIVESDTDIEYFRKLDVDVSFRIASLGETPLHNFHIRELCGVSDSETESATGTVSSKSSVFIDNHKTVGFRVDSVKPQAIDATNPDDRLILTVDSMIECYKQSLTTETDSQDTGLSQLISSSVLIYSNIRGNKLYELFLSRRLECDNNQITAMPQLGRKRRERLAECVKTSDRQPQLPESSLDIHTYTKPAITVDMLKYIIQLTELVGVSMTFEAHSPWDTLHTLSLQGLLCGENHRYMNILLGISLFQLTRADMFLECDSVSLSGDTATKPYQPPDKLSTLFVCLLLPLQKSLYSRLHKKTKSVSSFRMVVTEIFTKGTTTGSQFVASLVRDPFISKADFLYLVEVMLYAGNRRCGLNQLYDAVGKETVDSCQRFTEFLSTDLGISKSSPLFKKHVSICFLLFLYQSKHTEAIEYMAWLVKFEPDMYSALKQWEKFAERLSDAGKYGVANSVLKQLLIIVQEQLGVGLWDSLPDNLCNRLSSDIELSDVFLRHCKLVVRLHEGIEKNCEQLLSYSESVKHIEIALKLSQLLEAKDSYYKNRVPVLTNDIGIRYESMGEHSKSLQSFMESLRMWQSIVGEHTDHGDIAVLYMNTGGKYADLHNHHESVKYCTMSLDMFKALYGINTDNVSTAHAYSKLGSAYSAKGEYDKALECHSKALEMRKALHGVDADHSDIGNSHNNIAEVFLQLGAYTESLEHFTKSLDISKALHGDANHLDVARSYNNMANLYFSMGDNKKAIELYTKSLDIWKSLYGEHLSRPNIATTYNNIGAAYCDMEEYTQSLKYYTMSLEIKQKLYGDNSNHLDIINSYNNIGLVYFSLGKYTKSMEYLTKSLNMRKALHGNDKDHPSIASSYINIGRLYLDKGKYTESLRYLTRSLNMRKALHGGDKPHLDIASSCHSLGRLYSDMDEYTKSLDYYAKSLTIEKAVYGDVTDHPGLAVTYNNIGCTYMAMGQYTKSLEAHTKSLTIKRTLYGDGTDRIDIAISYSHIGRVYSGIGDHELSATYHTKALDMLKRLYGDDADHSLVATTYSHLGAQYSKMGQYTRAMVCLNKALDMRLALYGDIDHLHIAFSYSRIGELYSDKEEYNQSLEYHTESQNMLKVLYGESTDHPHVADGYSKLGNVYSDMGEHDKSLEHHTKSLDMKRALYGHVINHPSIATTLHDMANMYSNRAEYTTSLEYHNRSLQMRKLMYGEDSNHTDIAECYRKIGRVYGNTGYYTGYLVYINKAHMMFEVVRSKNYHFTTETASKDFTSQ